MLLGLLVLADPAQGDRGAVEEETPVCDPEIPEPRALLHRVDDVIIGDDLGANTVQIRVGRAPQARLVHLRGDGHGHRRAAVDLHLPDEHEHLLPGGVEQPAAHLDREARGARVADEHLHREVRGLRRDVARRDVDPGGRVLGGIDVEGMGLEEPDLAVEAAVEPVELLAEPRRQRVGGVGRVVRDAHGQDVVALHRCGTSVEDEAREGAAMLAEVGAVHVDVGKGRGAIEDEIERPADLLARHHEMHAIPRSAPRPLSPRVGHADRRPRVIVEGRRFRALEIVAPLEAPRAREEQRLALAAHRLQRRGHRGPGLVTAAGRGRGEGHEQEDERAPAPRPQDGHASAQALTRSRSRRSVSSTSTMSASVVFSSWSMPRWNCA